MMNGRHSPSFNRNADLYTIFSTDHKQYIEARRVRKTGWGSSNREQAALNYLAHENYAHLLRRNTKKSAQFVKAENYKLLHQMFDAEA